MCESEGASTTKKPNWRCWVLSAGSHPSDPMPAGGDFNVVIGLTPPPPSTCTHVCPTTPSIRDVHVHFPDLPLSCRALQELQRLLDAVDDTGAELWSIAEQTRDSVEALISAFEADGWAAEQAKTLVTRPPLTFAHRSCLHPRISPRQLSQ